MISEDAEGSDVRFFGHQHHSAKIPPASIKPIDVAVEALGVKKTAAHTKAMEELGLHQQMLGEVGDGGIQDTVRLTH